MSVVAWREQAVDQERAGAGNRQIRRLCLTADAESASGALTRCV